MAESRDKRASDTDRDRVAAELREHCAQGRLSVEEFNERLDAAYGAKTQGQLDALTADLPEIDPYALPVPAPWQGRPIQGLLGDVRMNRALRAQWAAWAAASLINFVIWAIIEIVGGGGDVYPWWVWVAGPWGAVLLTRTLFGIDRGDNRKQLRR